VTVPIILHGATGVACTDVKLTYDTSVVAVTDATAGDFTTFFGFDDEHAADGWVTINTYISGTQLTGDVKVADVTLVAVGEAGDTSPLDMEILAMADQNGTNIPGTTRNETFRILVPAPASAIPTTSTTTTTSTSTYPAGGENDSNGRVHTNIVMKEIKCAYANEGKPISHKFEKPMNDIVYVNFTTTIYAEDICTIVEVLKGTSASVETDPPDNVYRNSNIRVGLSRYATERDVRDANIAFRIDQNWIDTIDPSTVRSNVYHDDAWHPLKTTRLGEDESHAYFVADAGYF